MPSEYYDGMMTRPRSEVAPQSGVAQATGGFAASGARASGGWRFSLRGLFAVMTLLAVACALPDFYARWAVAQLHNDDLEVDGTYVGLSVNCNNPLVNDIEWLGRWANPALERALADPERFAAAHEMLRSVNQSGWQCSAKHWDQMRITLHGDGRVDFHPEQRPQLQALWRERLRGQ
jgi:hypothetical protein